MVYTEHTKREQDGDILICSRSSEELNETTNELSVKAGRMRAYVKIGGYRLRSLEGGKTEIVYLIDMDLGGSFAIGYLYRHMAQSYLKGVVDLHRKFAEASKRDGAVPEPPPPLPFLPKALAAATNPMLAGLRNTDSSIEDGLNIEMGRMIKKKASKVDDDENILGGAGEGLRRGGGFSVRSSKFSIKSPISEKDREKLRLQQLGSFGPKKGNSWKERSEKRGVNGDDVKPSHLPTFISPPPDDEVEVKAPPLPPSIPPPSDDEDDVKAPPLPPPIPPPSDDEDGVKPPSSPPPIFSNWTRLWDEKTQEYYYQHSDGVTSTWQKPDDYV
ncbi:hypothetical protein TrVE_jg13410 [Triparma verrucosa]|uniref:WW domain-containing protein n=1 Tax=Triparma verrucosa TaxID=1606542 RepID=A0A9W7KW21_9STRA|nr:hypothetical protein TrVE_jg13410 [Triparma verrucosa]